MIILDTDILIDFIKEKPDAIYAVKKAIVTGEAIRTTVINVQEVLLGKEDPISFLQELKPLDYTLTEMQETVKLIKKLMKKGKPIGRMDEMIAGICLANNAKLLTKNKKHFSKVPGLKVISW